MPIDRWKPDGQKSFELAPTVEQDPGQPGFRPVMTVAQRRAELESTRFIAVRNLAHIIYKRPDGKELMTFQETLDNRKSVFTNVLAYEVANGLIIDDGTLNQDTNQQTNGEQQMNQPNQPNMPFVPQQGAPNGQQQMMQQPTFVPQQGQQMAPPQQQMMQQAPQFQQPPQGQQVMQQGVPQQGAPAAEPPKQRQRRSAGAAVAPPPAAPPPTPGAAGGAAFVPQAGAAPQQGFTNGYQAPQQGQQQGFQPQAGAPAQQGFQAQPQQVAQAPITPPAQSGGADLSAVTARLDQIGTGLSSTSKDVDELKAQVAALTALNKQLLVALHHLYLTNPGTQGKTQAQTLGDFQNYLQPFVG